MKLKQHILCKHLIGQAVGAEGRRDYVPDKFLPCHLGMPYISDFEFHYRGKSCRVWLNCHLFEEVVILWGASRCHLQMIKSRTTPALKNKFAN